MEQWKDIRGYEGQYQISNFGNVRSLDRVILYENAQYLRVGKLMILRPNSRGYLRVDLYSDAQREQRFVHRLVAEHFLDAIDGKTIVNHINGVYTHNHIDNLEWVTQKENVYHGLKMHGRKNKYAEQ